MLVAPGAVLLPLHALRVQTLVLRGEVIPILALATGEDDLVARHGLFSKNCVKLHCRADDRD
jgi:hypothetical protein